MLLLHFMRRAASRAACTAGNSSATRTPMMAITTSSSTKVNARIEAMRCRCITSPVCGRKERIVLFGQTKGVQLVRPGLDCRLQQRRRSVGILAGQLVLRIVELAAIFRVPRRDDQVIAGRRSRSVRLRLERE